MADRDRDARRGDRDHGAGRQARRAVQDVLLDTHNHERFEATVAEAIEGAKGDTRVILGVADGVPADAELKRLEAIPSLVNWTLSM
jgi:hypothetical protein